MGVNNLAKMGKMLVLDVPKKRWRGLSAGVYKVCYLVKNNTEKYQPFYLRPDNTGHIISDRKILVILSKTGKYQASVWIKQALDITILEIDLVKKGVSDVKFILICIIIIKNSINLCYFVNHKLILEYVDIFDIPEDSG